MTGPAKVLPSARAIMVTIVITMILVCALVLPAFIDSAKTSLNTIAGEGEMRRLSALALMEMLTGTANYVLVLILVILFIAGLVVATQKNRLLAITLS